jgi:hypothetical protein
LQGVWFGDVRRSLEVVRECSDGTEYIYKRQKERKEGQTADWVVSDNVSRFT